MSETYVPTALRRLVVARAARRCEYCLIHEDDTLWGCEVDHVVSEKHGGATVSENLALACVPCNRRKGSDIASIDRATGALTRLFNPRTDRWPDHFVLVDGGSVIQPLTPVGAVTVGLLQLNAFERVLEREALRDCGDYPPEAFWYVA